MHLGEHVGRRFSFRKNQAVLLKSAPMEIPSSI
jgi:hypothetical protein